MKRSAHPPVPAETLAAGEGDSSDGRGEFGRDQRGPIHDPSLLAHGCFERCVGGGGTVGLVPDTGASPLRRYGPETNSLNPGPPTERGGSTMTPIGGERVL